MKYKKPSIWRLLLVLLLLITSVNDVYSQTDNLNLTKYWNLRDRQKKLFVKIGTEAGESLTASNRSTDANLVIPRMKWGDATLFHGYYLAVLATEYKLLKNAGADYTSTLNELYYAIEAFNRLDLEAEFYLSNGEELGESNGFFIRDDIPCTFADKWTEEGIDEVTGDHSWTDSCDRVSRRGNEASMDQVIGLFMGFKFIKELVDNHYVKPTASDRGFYIHNEIIDIVNRIIVPISLKHSWIERRALCITSNIWANKELTSSWVLWNPVLEDKVERGHMFFFYRYPIAEIAESIVPNSNYGEDYWRHIDPAWATCLPHTYIRDMDQAENFWVNQLQNNVSANSFTHQWIIGATLEEMLSMSDPLGNVNMQMMLCLAAISNTWSANNISTYSIQNDMILFEIMNAVLYDRFTMITQQSYRDLLSSCPWEGPNTLETSSNWRHSSRWMHPARPGFEEEYGEYNGLDYMLLYNLYHLAFAYNNLPDYANPDLTCLPTTLDIFGDLNSSNELQSYYTFRNRRPEYADMGITMQEYFSYEMRIKNSGVFDAKFNLVMCQTEVKVEGNGTMIVGESGVSQGTYTKVTNGSELTVGDGTLNLAQLIVNNNSTLIIDDDASLLIKNGANIVLDGPNAVIEVRGNIKILDGATFSYTGGTNGMGYIRFIGHEDNEPYILGFPNTTTSILPSIHIIGLNNNHKVIELIEGELSIGTDIRTATVENCKIELNTDLQINIFCPVAIHNTSFDIIQGGTTHNGLHLYGQETDIINCNFTYGNYGVKGHNYQGTNGLKLTTCNFVQCNYGVWAQDKGMELTSCTFSGCNYSVKGVGMSFNSTFKNMTANYSGTRVIDYTGGRTSNLKLTRPQYLYNTNGVRFKGGTVSSYCGIIGGGGTTNPQYGFKVDIMSNIHLEGGPDRGKNQIVGNYHAIEVNYANVFLDNGFNNFQSDHMTVFGNGYGNGTNGNIIANSNFWTYGTPQSPLNAITTVSYPLGQTANYSLGETLITSSGGTVSNAVYMSDYSYLNSPPDYSALCVQCCQNVTLDGYRPGTDLILNTTSFTNTPMSFAVEAAIDSIYPDSTANYLEAIDLFHEILTYNYPTTLDDEQEEVLELAYDKMAEAVGNAYLYGQIENLEYGIHPSVQKLLDVQDIMATRYQTPENNFRDQMRKSKYNLDQATTYRLINDRTTALNILSSMLNWETNQEVIDEINIWDCIITKEKLVLDSTIDLDSMERMPLCEQEESGNGGTALPIFASIASKDIAATQFKVYPNPFTESTTIEYLLVSASEVNISITDINGKEVYRHTSQNEKGKHQLIFNSNNLAKGIYFCKIKTGSYIKTVKLTLIK